MHLKRIVLITNLFPYGNGEAFIEKELPYLSQYFDDIKVIAINPNEKQIRNNFIGNAESINFKNTKLVRVLSLAFILHPYFWLEIIDMLKRKKFCIKNISNALLSLKNAKKIAKKINLSNNLSNSIIYSYWGNDTALAMTFLKNKTNKKLCRFHRWDLYEYTTSNNYLPYKSIIAKKIDFLCFISEDGEKYFFENYKLNSNLKSKSSIYKLGVEAINTTNKAESFDVINMVSCSLIYPNKRVDLIVKALALVKNVRINWVHFGTVLDENHFKKIKFEIDNSLSKNTNITYKFMGDRPNTEVLEFYSKNTIHFFINTSISEGLPVSIMEAMASSIPVLATDSGGTKEIVNNGNGKLVKNDITAQELAKEIVSFVSELKNNFPEISQNAHNTWQNNFNAKNNFEKFSEFLNSQKTR